MLILTVRCKGDKGAEVEILGWLVGVGLGDAMGSSPKRVLEDLCSTWYDVGDDIGVLGQTQMVTDSDFREYGQTAVGYGWTMSRMWEMVVGGWKSAKAKPKGTVAELYAMMPQSLHKHMETYPLFGSLSIKEVTGILFMLYKLDSSLVTGQHASKGTDPSFLLLIKQNGIGDYVCLAPILFANLDSMDADGFLKNPILIKVITLTVKAVSSF
ncbi:hypothetical protein OG21DRAFT_1520707 [Imleria badia]|nr:hypothetical protein OG21DRAFT_1520707 [Imleria badia]